MPVLRRAWPWLLGAVGLWVANAWLISSDVNPLDESWTLQIVRRLGDGEALYRDVWFGVTPLSVYLLWGAVGILGEEILVVKGLLALLAAGNGLLVARIAMQVGAGPWGAVVCALVTLSLAPALASLYTPLAVLLLLVCETLALTAFRQHALRWVIAAGCAAGLSFAAKQNVGGLAIAALLASLILVEPTRNGVRRLLAAALAFGAVGCATVLAMAATGGPRIALDALGLAKGSYLRLGRVPYQEMVGESIRNVARPGAWRDLLAGRDRDLLLTTPRVLLPILAVFLLAAAWAVWARRPHSRRGLDPMLTTVTSFAAAGFAGAYPRFDSPHLAWVAPAILVALAAAVVRTAPAVSRPVRVVGVCLAAAWAAFALLGPVGDWRSGDRVRVGLPHFAGAWTSREQRDRADRDLRHLDEALPERTVFIVLGKASFYYLAGGFRNPTRFDYPASTSIGKREADEILEGVADGTVRVACLADPTADVPLRADELERRLREVLRPGPDVGLCRLWFPR